MSQESMTQTSKLLIRARRRPVRDERGATLVMALVFLSVFGLLVGVLLSLSDTSSRTASAYRDVRGRNHAVDAALDGAINKVKQDTTIGIDPEVSPTDVCNEDTGSTLFSLPADPATAEPAMVVSCVVGAGSGSGVPKDLGSAPLNAVLTLGDKQTNGTTQSLATRNNEPGPYNGTYSFLFSGGECEANHQEQGIRENRSMSPVLLNYIIGVVGIGCTTASNASAWNVMGNVISNSTIVTDDSSAGPIVVPPTDSGQPTGQIKAKYGCTGTGFTCSSDAPTTAELSDPDYAPPDISGLDVQTVPSSSQCGTNGGTRNDVVTFSPGIYTDATALNNLFKASACKNTTFLFPPVKDTTTGEYTATGLYYFNFQNTSTTSLECGQEQFIGSFIATLPQDVKHEWCIGGAGADYSGQRVIGGAPYNWDPSASPTSSILTLEPASSAGDGPGIFFGLIRQRTAFEKGDSCGSGETIKSCGVAIDGKTDNYSMSSGKNGSSIWVSGFPKMSRGAIQKADIEVAQAATNASGMNNPTVQINFGTKYGDPFNTDKCGPYTLAKPGTSIGTVTLSATDSTALTNCLNTGDAGDRLNNGTIQYNVSRSSGTNVAKLDGIRLKITVAKQPTFPRMPSAADEGGDCDTEQPGVQFIFGGDSHVYVPNGGLEICAGPNMANQMTGQQIAVYGVPAVPRLIPSSVTAYTAGVTNPNNALQIAEGSGLVSASVPYNGTMTMRMPSYSAPSGLSITGAQLRVSYNPQSASGSNAPQISIKNTSGTTLCSITLDDGAGMQANTYSPSCLQSALASSFDLQFQAKGSGSCSGSGCPQLDGVQVIITTGLASTSAAGQRTLVPGNGCVTASPNLWYSTGNADCALLKSDSSFSTSFSTSRGRMSVKGTIYAPSAAIDIADNDVYYPIAGRGVVARHLRIRGYQTATGYGTPAFSNYLDKSQTARAVVFFACEKSSGACTADESIGRAAVTFDADTQTPTVENWTVSKN
jgi:hypothetical protein